MLFMICCSRIAKPHSQFSKKHWLTIFIKTTSCKLKSHSICFHYLIIDNPSWFPNWDNTLTVNMELLLHYNIWIWCLMSKLSLKTHKPKHNQNFKFNKPWLIWLLAISRVTKQVLWIWHPKNWLLHYKMMSLTKLFPIIS